MTRGQKKFLYGTFYLVILALIVWVFIPASKAPVPVPAGNTAQFLPLQSVGTPYVFKSEGVSKIVLLAQVKNPNADYGAESFPYSFSVYGKNGGVLAEIPGSESIYPNETKYVVSSYDVSGLNLADVGDRADFEIGNPIFRPAAQFSPLNLVLAAGPIVATSTSGLVVSGSVNNQGAFPVAAVRVVALIVNKYGDPVFAGQTLLSQVGGFEEREFSIFFPADRNLIGEAAARSPRVFLNEE